jgi:DNA-binding GntR family transcriptional regulator
MASDQTSMEQVTAHKTQLGQLNYQPLHERAYRSLREALRTGRLKPGQAITSRYLVTQLGISTTPIREALQRLIGEQALQMLPNRTIIVPVLTRARYTEITKVRLRLEGLAAQEAVGNISDGTVEQLARHQAAMEEALQRREFSVYLEHNERFHFTLYEQSRMPFLLLMIELAWLQIGPWLNVLIDEGRFRDVANVYHGEIVNLVAARDGAGVMRAVQQDIAEAARHLLGHLPSDGEPTATPEVLT